MKIRLTLTDATGATVEEITGDASEIGERALGFIINTATDDDQPSGGSLTFEPIPAPTQGALRLALAKLRALDDEMTRRDAAPNGDDYNAAFDLFSPFLDLDGVALAASALGLEPHHLRAALEAGRDSVAACYRRAPVGSTTETQNLAAFNALNPALET